MPTPTGGETIGEALKRLRSDLASLRASRKRAQDNGQSSNLGGAAVTEIAYERYAEREAAITSQISGLEARLSGSGARPGIALTVTKLGDC